MSQFPAFKPLRCDDCCDLWQPAPDRLRIASESGLTADPEPELTRKTGIPAHYVNATFEQFAATTPRKAQSLAEAKRWTGMRIEDIKEASTFILSGPPGTGKTHLASCMARMIFEAGTKVKMTKFSMLSRRLTEAAQKGEGQEELCIEYYSKFPVLFLDEVRPNAFSKTMEPKMWDIFDNRWDRELPTVITSNVKPSELSLIFPAPTLSRMSRNQVIAVCDGEDYRVKNNFTNRLNCQQK